MAINRLVERYSFQSLAREDTNHTLSKKAKNESHRDGFLIQATSRLDWFGSPAA